MDKIKLVRAKLKDYQIEGFEWMSNRENSDESFGMLLDQTGVGKTMQMIALICDSYNVVTNTLIVCPASVVGVWKNEIMKHTWIKEREIFVYRGRNRRKLWRDNGDSYKIIITSYKTLVCDRDKKVNSGNEFLEGIFEEEFGRVVLDEAHHIKNRESITSKLCYKLKSRRRWVITATPVHNNIDDIYSLLRFLGYYESLMEWKKDINRHRDDVNKYLNRILREYGIRRLKKDVLNLPERRDNVVMLKFNRKDRIFYNMLLKYLKSRISKQIEEYGNKENRRDATDYIISTMRLNSVKTMILRMRQACNSPQIVIDGMDRLNGMSIDEAIEELKKDVRDDCRICMDRNVNGVLNPCGHKVFCMKCINSVLNKHNACPICKNIVYDVIDSEENNNKNRERERNRYINCTKSEYVMRIIRDKIKESKNSKGIIVYSQWVSMLNLVIEKFKVEFPNVEYMELTGRMSLNKRQEMIDSFQSKDGNMKVIFISLMAGSEGITLTNANIVIHIEPWWNSQRTLQGSERAYRMGQDDEVDIYYLYIVGTIEVLMKEYYIDRKDKYVNTVVEGKIDMKDDKWMDRMIKFTNDLKEIPRN